jgi:hypothetical protein
MELPRHRTPVQNFGGGILPGGTRAVPLMFGEIWPTQIWLSQEDAPPQRRSERRRKHAVCARWTSFDAARRLPSQSACR